MKKSQKTLPKGSYRLPRGNYAIPGKPGASGVRVSAVAKAEPDLKQLANAIIALAKELNANQGE